MPKCEETNQILTVIQLIKLWGIMTTFMFIDELQWVNLIGLISEFHVKKQSNKFKFIYYTVSDRKNATFSVAVFECFNNIKVNIQYTILIRKD